MESAHLTPPTIDKRPVVTTHHGHERVDDFDWLRDPESPEVLGYLEAENAYTQQRTAHLADLRATIFEEIKSRTLETDLSVPVRRGDWWYYSRSFKGRQYGAQCRVSVTADDDWTPPQPAGEASPDEPALPGEEVLLDLNALAEGHEYFSLGGSSLSLDGRHLAWSTDVVGDERYTVFVKSLTTGELLSDSVTGVLGGVTWHPDGTSFYYTTVNDSWRPDKVWRHQLGTDQSADELVYEDPDERFFVSVGRTRNDRWLMISSGSKTTSEVRFLDTTNPDATWQVFADRVEGLEYHVEAGVIGGVETFLVLHNATGPDFELARTPAAPTAPDQWQTLIAFDPEVRLEDVDAFAGHIVVHQRSGGLTQLRILELGAEGVGDDYLIEFDSPVRTVSASGNPDFDQPYLRLAYSSLATPASVYDYDVARRHLMLRRQTPVLGGYEASDYTEERVWATAPDGERVPMSLIYRTDARTPGQPMPVLLYGYGSYEYSVDPSFGVSRLSLLDRGAAFAIAHIRGGGEMGRRWYDNGKLRHKQNTFTDFIACARHLSDTGFTRPDLIVAEGGSAGGLLMGAVVNQAPDAFGGIVAVVPFVDALTTMLDPTLPLTVTEYDEWGNPTDDPDAYADIAAYAPYDNVAAVDYPPILAESSLADTRVLFVEATKWVARLRDRAVGRRDFLLKTEMTAGHGGVSGRYKAWEDRAFSLAWMLERMGLS